jgi:hypothetical protein
MIHISVNAAEPRFYLLTRLTLDGVIANLTVLMALKHNLMVLCFISQLIRISYKLQAYRILLEQSDALPNSLCNCPIYYQHLACSRLEMTFILVSVIREASHVFRSGKSRMSKRCNPVHWRWTNAESHKNLSLQ